MINFSYTIKDPLGIHARPAGMLVKKISEHVSSVTINKDGKKADGRKLFSLMGLAVKCGNVVEFEVEGEDEQAAAAALKEFVEATL